MLSHTKVSPLWLNILSVLPLVSVSVSIVAGMPMPNEQQLVGSRWYGDTATSWQQLWIANHIRLRRWVTIIVRNEYYWYLICIIQYPRILWFPLHPAPQGLRMAWSDSGIIIWGLEIFDIVSFDNPPPDRWLIWRHRYSVVAMQQDVTTNRRLGWRITNTSSLGAWAPELGVEYSVWVGVIHNNLQEDEQAESRSMIESLGQFWHDQLYFWLGWLGRQESYRSVNTRMSKIT